MDQHLIDLIQTVFLAGMQFLVSRKKPSQPKE